MALAQPVRASISLGHSSRTISRRASAPPWSKRNCRSLRIARPCFDGAALTMRISGWIRPVRCLWGSTPCSASGAVAQAPLRVPKRGFRMNLEISQ